MRDLFDAAQERRDAALSKVKDNSGDWFGVAFLQLVQERGKVKEFTGEDIRNWLVPHVGRGHSPNVWGALTRHAIALKLIAPTGQWTKMKAPKSHARQTPVYRWC